MFSLEKIFQKEEQEFSFKRLFRQIFLDDWMMKLIALTITLALWLGVTGLGTTEDERLRGIELNLGVSNEMEITKSPIKKVDLVVSGDTRKINQIKRDDLILFYDLKNELPGERTIELTPETVTIDLPAGVRLREIQPSRIDITLEIVEKREIPIRAETENNLPDGFEIYGVSVIPQRIPARGPASYISSIDHISTEKIDLSGHRGDFTAQQVPLNVANLKLTLIDETTVNVFFRIGEKRIERLFIVPVKKEGEKRTATVVLYGARTLLNELKGDSLQVEMVDSEAAEGSLRLVLPNNLQGQVEIRKLQINGRK